MHQLNNYLVGAALALAIAAFVLALWPAVADAPWEKQEVHVEIAPLQLQDSLSQSCLELAQTKPTTREGSNYIVAELKKLGCIE